MKNKRLLFLLKKNETYGFQQRAHRRSSGLWNSTKNVATALKHYGLKNIEVVEVEDNNSIDRELSRYKPDLCIVEALWVVPAKFDVLKKLHPKVKFAVHMHSGIPFLAMEGIAIEWLIAYEQQGVHVIANSIPSYDALASFLGHHAVTLCQNIYSARFDPAVEHYFSPEHQAHFGKPPLKVICPGAIRPLKNQLIQAMAALKFARGLKRRLRFFINASRVEVNGDPVLKNLRALFHNNPHGELVELDWHEPEELPRLFHQMDIGMQVSLTETFNICTADMVSAGLPVVVSKEIKWVSKICMADDDNIEDIVGVMHRIFQAKLLIKWNQYCLSRSAESALNEWLRYIKTV